MPETDRWQQWTDVLHVIQLSSGTHFLNVVSTTQGWNLNWFEISVAEFQTYLEGPSISESEEENTALTWRCYFLVNKAKQVHILYTGALLI